MPDMDKVIKGLNDIGGFIAGRVGFEQARNFLRTIDDALALLKEQEEVEPRVSTAEQRCGHCNKVIEMDRWKACPWCGKMIDWKRWWNKNGTHDNT